MKWRLRKPNSDSNASCGDAASQRLLPVGAARWFTITPVLLVLACVLAACVQDANDGTARMPYTVRGRVLGPEGPVSNAIVQIQSSTNRATTGADGAYVLHGESLGGRNAITVTAWAEDHFIGMSALDPKAAAQSVDVTLQPIFDRDNHDTPGLNSAANAAPKAAASVIANTRSGRPIPIRNRQPTRAS